MRSGRLWARLLGVEKTTVERVEYDEEAGVITAHVKPHERERRRCPQCRRRCPVYDRGEGRRRWRALDLGTVVAELEADAPRISCREHGVLVAAVPWARHHAGHTRFFDDQVAWLAVQTSKTAVTRLMRVAWRTVGAIITRVVADIDAGVDRLEGLRRIGIDEISYKKGHRYILVTWNQMAGWIVTDSHRDHELRGPVAREHRGEVARPGALSDQLCKWRLAAVNAGPWGLVTGG